MYRLVVCMVLYVLVVLYPMLCASMCLRRMHRVLRLLLCLLLGRELL